MIHEYLTPKRTIILMGVVCTAIIAPFDMVFMKGTWAAKGTTFIFLLVTCVLIYFWCYFDGRERNQTISSPLRWGIILSGQVGLYIYMFKTRGFKLGIMSIGKSIILWLMLGIVYSLSGATVLTLLGLEAR